MVEGKGLVTIFAILRSTRKNMRGGVDTYL